MHRERERKLLELINEFKKVEGYKSILKNKLYFHTLAMNNRKTKLIKQFHLQYHHKK